MQVIFASSKAISPRTAAEPVDYLPALAARAGQTAARQSPSQAGPDRLTGRRADVHQARRLTKLHDHSGIQHRLKMKKWVPLGIGQEIERRGRMDCLNRFVHWMRGDHRNQMLR
jgi:hypothetical protein